MGFTLGFHIVLACLGVAFPAMMLIAEWHGHRKKDPEALRLARNWSKAVAVLFAVGAVTRHRPLLRVRPALAAVHGPLR